MRDCQETVWPASHAWNKRLAPFVISPGGYKYSGDKNRKIAPRWQDVGLVVHAEPPLLFETNFLQDKVYILF